ncbi:hypothetical protein G2W53_024866 [Senna tora]|uniref:Uncharacterized protein n=1 Tax=Senna tora TaxID=362788 RepID=A0A834WHB6_9FABA|nr:hypothetical protein G2W53_024866 [Senna tora]
MKVKGEEKKSVKSEEDESVNENCLSVGVHATKLKRFVVSSQQEDANKGKIENSVDQYGDATCLEASELNEPAFAWYLNQQPWSQ